MEIKSTFIRKRNDNYNVYIEYIDENGKSKQKSQGCYKTKKEAEIYLIDLKSSINNSKFVISKDITLVDRCYRYLKDNEDTFSHYTISNRRSWMKNHFEPFWEDTLLKDVTPYKLQAFVNLFFKKFTVESAKVRYGFLRAILSESYRLREINENPCNFIKLPKVRDTFEASVYTKEEVQRLISVLDENNIEAPILLMLLLGLRFGEAVGLRWSDIDFDKNIININQILTLKTNEGFIFKEPKTADSKRSLHAPDELIKKLKKIKKYQNELKLEGTLENKYDLVCLNSSLRPWSNANLTSSFKKLLKDNNFKTIRLHDLRHTNATIMLLSGTNMKTVSSRLGHSDIKISMNKYSHVLEEMDKEASENLSNILFK